MKITYDSNDLPALIRRPKLTNEEQNFLNLLENDTAFETKVLKIRKCFGIPKGGYKLAKIGLQEKQWKKIRKRLVPINKDFTSFYDAIVNLRNEYLLTYHWHPGLEHFVIFDILLPPLTYTSVGLYPGIFCDCDIQKPPHWHEAKDYVLIGIEADINKTELHRWIDKNWPDIKTELSKLPRHPKPKFKIELYREIANLNKQGIKPRKIASTLTDKNPKWVYSDAEVGTYLSRHKKHLKKIRNKTS